MGDSTPTPFLKEGGSFLGVGREGGREAGAFSLELTAVFCAIFLHSTTFFLFLVHPTFFSKIRKSFLSSCRGVGRRKARKDRKDRKDKMMAIPVQIFRSTSLFSNDGGGHGHSLRGERADTLRRCYGRSRYPSSASRYSSHWRASSQLPKCHGHKARAGAQPLRRHYAR